MYRLELDVGNSRTKWRLAELGLCGNFPSAALCGGESLPPQWGQLPIESIWLGSVMADDATEAAIAHLQKAFTCDVYRAYSSPAAGGLINGYADANRLGVDRWLALLAARQVAPGDLVVVDAGTAITLDLVRADGKHLGGYILPGVTRQAQSLWGGTGRVQVEAQVLKPRLVPGQDTQACVEAAITAAIAGLCGCGERLLPGATWCLTGGDFPWLEAICTERGLPFSHQPDLVLDGLAHAHKRPYLAS